MGSSSIGSRLREERLRLGFSQTALASLAGKTKHALINWEKGLRSPTAEALAAFAKAGADPLYIVTGHRGDRPTVGDGHQRGIAFGAAMSSAKAAGVLIDAVIGRPNSYPNRATVYLASALEWAAQLEVADGGLSGEEAGQLYELSRTCATFLNQRGHL